MLKYLTSAYGVLCSTKLNNKWKEKKKGKTDFDVINASRFSEGSRINWPFDIICSPRKGIHDQVTFLLSDQTKLQSDNVSHVYGLERTQRDRCIEVYHETIRQRNNHKVSHHFCVQIILSWLNTDVQSIVWIGCLLITLVI